MKSAILFRLPFILSISFFQLSIGCQSSPTGVTNPPGQISLLTDQTSYAGSEAVKLFLQNNSGHDITVGLRCGFYLEMFYQKKEDNGWSDDLWFPYMSLLCPTHLRTVGVNTTFEHSIPTEMFDSTGTLRLFIDVHVPETEATVRVMSNVFKIE
jgi:hypothetical protein